MRKWMYILPHITDLDNSVIMEGLHKYNDSLVKFEKEFNVKLERQYYPYLLFIVLADQDLDSKYYSIGAQFNELYNLASSLKINYHVLYKGRKYYNKLDTISKKEMIKSIDKQINFIKPEYLFIKDTSVTYDSVDDFILEDIFNFILKTNTNYETVYKYSPTKLQQHLIYTDEMFTIDKGFLNESNSK